MDSFNLAKLKHDARMRSIQRNGRNITQQLAYGGGRAAGPSPEPAPSCPERVPHWTDNTTERPIFDSVIDARGSRSNIVAISAAAQSMLLDLHVPYDRVQELSNAVTMAGSYEEAIKLVEKWFKVDRGEVE